MLAGIEAEHRAVKWASQRAFVFVDHTVVQSAITVWAAPRYPMALPINCQNKAFFGIFVFRFVMGAMFQHRISLCVACGVDGLGLWRRALATATSNASAVMCDAIWIPAQALLTSSV